MKAYCKDVFQIMLIERNDAPAINDIVAFRLISGEEVVGKLVAQSSATLTLTRPVAIAMQMVSPSQAQLSFAPFMTAAADDGRVVFSQTALATQPMHPRRDVMASYIKATAGIEVPDAATARILAS